MSGRALAVSDDGGQHDRPVDLGPATLSRCCCSSLEYSFQVVRNKNLRRPARIATRLDLANVGGNFACQPRQIDIRSSQDTRGIGVLRQRQQEMLERDFRVVLGIRVARGARKRRSKVLRHRNAPEFINNHPPDQCLPATTIAPRLSRNRTVYANALR